MNPSILLEEHILEGERAKTRGKLITEGILNDPSAIKYTQLINKGNK